MSAKEWKNKLYFGDCLDILKEFYSYNKEGFIDLIYIDPPFNSKRNYNILYEEAHLTDTKAQKEAFADTWSNVSYKNTLQEIQTMDVDLHKFLEALDRIRVSKSAAAYLTTMAIRIYYMHKVLKDTGSFYLHCDPTMSHYLKLVCDLIFGKENFRNEIAWCYRKWSINQKQFVSNHDSILFYAKSPKNTFNILYISLSQGTLKRWKGKKQRAVFNEDGNRIATSDNEKSEGSPMPDWWEISIINPAANERLGYPTQKPEALLERIIKASSNKGDLVADLFCGCGTTVAAAQKLKRRWIGADISHLAIGLIEKRLIGTYGKTIKQTYEIDGFPKDLASAKQLAAGTEKGRLKFQEWVIEAKLLGVCNPKKTADGGWDGHLTFDFHGKKETVLVEVKSGHVNVKNLREFIHVVKKQKASMGALVCFKEYVTKPMLSAAKDEGYFAREFFGTTYDKIQIITVDDLLDGETVKRPTSTKETFKAAQKAGEKHTVIQDEIL